MLIQRLRNGERLLKRMLTLLLSCATLAVDDSSFTWPSCLTGQTGYGVSYKPLHCPCKANGTFFVPTGVTTIPPAAFAWCTKITSVTGMADVTSIKDHAFAYSGLNNIHWPAGATVIPRWAFDEATELRKITGLDALTDVGGWAFYGTRNLPDVFLPANCSVGPSAFEASRGTPKVGNHEFYGTHIPPPSPPPQPPRAPPHPPKAPPVLPPPEAVPSQTGEGRPNAPPPQPPPPTMAESKATTENSSDQRLEVVLPVTGACVALAVGAIIFVVIARRRSRTRAFARHQGPGVEKGRPGVESHPVVAPDGDVSLATRSVS